MKRGNIWWSFFYDEDGKRHQLSTRTTSLREAKKIEPRLREEHSRPQRRDAVIDLNLTFAELAARFVSSGSLRPHHLYHLKFLLPFFGTYSVRDFTRSLADEFRRERQLANLDHPCKPATVNRDLSTLRRILYWGLDERLLEANPLARLRMARERRTRRQVVSISEEQKLLAAAPGHLQAMIVAALDTGMRRGEITSQRWEDIDFDGKVLFVSRSKTPEGESREIPLTDRLFKLLTSHRAYQGLVFTYRGEPVRIIKTTWQTSLRKADLRHIRFHDLRHTFNCRLMEAGVMQEIRMTLMGHSAGHQVHYTYVHVELPHKRQAIARLELWLEQQRQQLTGGNNDSAKAGGNFGEKSIGFDKPVKLGKLSTETMEEKITGRRSTRAGEETARGNRRNGSRPEREAVATQEVRRSPQDLRKRLTKEERR
jgi:integrase